MVFTPFALPAFSCEKWEYMAAFDIEKWSTVLKPPFTFATATSGLTQKSAVAIIHCYQERLCNRKNAVTPEDGQGLKSLERMIDDLMGSIRVMEEKRTGAPMNAQGYFVRLGPRSPKDSPLVVTGDKSRTAVYKALLESASKLGVAHRYSNGDHPSAEQVLGVFEAAAGLILQVKTAHEAVSLLTRSFRVAQDLSHALDYCSTKRGTSNSKLCKESSDCGEEDSCSRCTLDSPFWNVSLVVRPWVKDVQVSREFRAFVVNSQLVALSQYDDRIANAEMYDHVLAMAATICKLFESVRATISSLGHVALVIDFAVSPFEDNSKEEMKEEWQAHMIELNPFGPMTGSSLFDWRHERRILQGGQDCFGDLDAHEVLYPPKKVLPEGAVEAELTNGVILRYRMHGTNPSMTFEELEMSYPDFWKIWIQDIARKAGTASPTRKNQKNNSIEC
eukprot:CAMPEP_0113935568 /NCGR_PEP_ID=MMETSP1339-20121228/2708_1 /TAXON_ID=94617 /ORGANISM="Fibrocapsa japonica" /LENGTH=446 /DNA_ID=CAMNT_0000937777 /DNA_START=1 /DNA_END=1341 /DNA_ORIENTATION=- /assembly_acc=CAM_ASM_000762